MLGCVDKETEMTFRDMNEFADTFGEEAFTDENPILFIYEDDNDFILKANDALFKSKQGTKLERAINAISNSEYSFCNDIFDSRNMVGDAMETIYKDEDIQVDICRTWGYFEVFGLSDEEYSKLENFYYSREDDEPTMEAGDKSVREKCQEISNTASLEKTSPETKIVDMSDCL